MATTTSDAVLFHLLGRHMCVPDQSNKGIVGDMGVEDAGSDSKRWPGYSA